MYEKSGKLNTTTSCTSIQQPIQVMHPKGSQVHVANRVKPSAPDHRAPTCNDLDHPGKSIVCRCMLAAENIKCTSPACTRTQNPWAPCDATVCRCMQSDATHTAIIRHASAYRKLHASHCEIVHRRTKHEKSYLYNNDQ